MKNPNSTLAFAEPLPYEDQSYDWFAELDQAYENFGVTPKQLAFYGQYKITNPVILETPAEVTNRGYVLTNPSQIETITQINSHGQEVQRDFAYFRHEPATLHLGHTESRPYFIEYDRQGKPYLEEFADARVLPGEDPRIMPGVKKKLPGGKVREGWLISTVLAKPKPENPADVKSIKQVFYWGENLNDMEPIAELNETKNTTIYPVSAGRDDTSLDVFTRPHPHISYLRLPGITDLTDQAINSDVINITEDLLPEGFHCGPNFVKAKGRNHRELDVHEAVAELFPENKKVLHYRLARYGYELPRRGLSKGRLTPLGKIATRPQFPYTVPKPPENGVLDYSDILYGSMGRVRHGASGGAHRVGRMITGLSDSRVALADVVRVS